MEKLNDKKIDTYYKYACLVISSIAICCFLFILKGLFYLLFNVNLKSLSGNELLVANVSYYFFSIIISIYFFVRNKNSSLNDFKKYMRYFIIGGVSISVYFLMSFLELFVLYFFNIDYSSLMISSKTIYLIAFETLIMTIIALINNETLSKCIKNFKFKQISSYFKYYVLALVLMALSNYFINFFNSSIAPNEQIVRSNLKIAPVYMIFSACFFAPFSEEMIFRQSIRNIIKNKTAFIITSGLVFGGLHVISSFESFYDLLFIIPYSIPGFMFAYILVKSDNILYPMSFHFFHNTFLIILQLFALFIK
jgi:membrane protease YdiL (CAAX protease family)